MERSLRNWIKGRLDRSLGYIREYSAIDSFTYLSTLFCKADQSFIVQNNPLNGSPCSSDQFCD